MIKFEGFDLDNIIIDEKSCENTLVFNALYKTLMLTLHKKCSFPIRIFSVNMTKFAENLQIFGIIWSNFSSNFSSIKLFKKIEFFFRRKAGMSKVKILFCEHTKEFYEQFYTFDENIIKKSESVHCDCDKKTKHLMLRDYVHTVKCLLKPMIFFN